MNITTIKKEPLQEEEIKRVLADYLVGNGWNVKVAWGHQQGIDIDADRNALEAIGKRFMPRALQSPDSSPEQAFSVFGAQDTRRRQR